VVADAAIANGAPLRQATCALGGDDEFRLDATDGGYSRIVARHSGLCLDVSGYVSGRTNVNGMPLQQWSCGDGPNQQFSVQPR
jgi:hypothetical protein